MGCVGLAVEREMNLETGDIENWTLSRGRRIRGWRIGRILRRGGSCCRGHGPSTGAVHEVMPAETDASAEEHRHNCTDTVGSQLRSEHRRWPAVGSQAVMPEPASASLRFASITQVTNRPVVRAGRSAQRQSRQTRCFSSSFAPSPTLDQSLLDQSVPRAGHIFHRPTVTIAGTMLSDRKAPLYSA